MSKRVLGFAAASLLAIVGCDAAATPQPKSEGQVEPATAKPEPPKLDAKVTGRSTEDPEVTIERCKKTGWSYSGCKDTYPVQGRAWVEYACATEAAANVRPILCGRHAEYLIEGVGGPADRDAGLKTLNDLCDAGTHLSCYKLAQQLQYGDLDKATAAAKRGCGDADRSPIGCRSLLPALESQRRFEGKVTEVTGLDGLAPGGPCVLWVSPLADGRCSGRLSCGEHVVYGRDESEFPCSSEGAHLRGGEDMTTSKDGDGALSFDTAKGTIRFSDDESGHRGAAKIVATLTR